MQILTFVSSLVRIQNRKESLPLTDMRYISGWVDKFTADQHAVYKRLVRKQLPLPKRHWQREFALKYANLLDFIYNEHSSIEWFDI